ncbi:hypothetical protein OIV83_002612 [Microbotryomycetes sp. JL201]|nr:hypothetical protein OIV83_002612 [Microbotryomycetes sp. JL201]
MSYGGGGGNYGQPSQQPRSNVIFVGNLPFDYTEEQLTEVFSSVGPVVSFRLVFDRETGRAKGFGFCEYRDPETAASALRNLQGVEVGGRGLRLDFADTEEASSSKRSRRQGGGGGGSGDYSMTAAPSSYGGGGARADDQPRPLPPGVPLAPGSSATDSISHTLGTMPPAQLLDIMSQMKALVTASPYEARALLTANPQLSYALFQAMIMMNIVDPSTLTKMLPQAAAIPEPAPVNTPPYGGPASGYGGRPPYGAPPPAVPAPYGGPPPAGYGGRPAGYPPNQPTPPPGQSGPPPRPYGAPQPAAQPQSAPPQVAPEQAALIQQVLSMTQEQIDALPAESRNTIMQIRAQAGFGPRR